MIPTRTLLFPLLLAGCATDQGSAFPSLAPRAVETRSWDDPAPAAPVPVAADPALDGQVAAQVRALAAAKSAFDIAAARAAPLAAAAAADSAGGERWVAAQTALAELDATRATTVDAGEALHAMALARAADGQPDYPALSSAADNADVQLAAETAAISALQARLPTG